MATPINFILAGCGTNTKIRRSGENDQMVDFRVLGIVTVVIYTAVTNELLTNTNTQTRCLFTAPRTNTNTQ